MSQTDVRQTRVKKFYDGFARNYDASRYGSDEQKQLDLDAKSAVLDLLRDWKLSNKHVLDCGCGTGRFSELFASLGSDVVGVDASPQMLEIARQKVPEATFCVRDIFDLGFDCEFDIVLCSQVLTHLHEYQLPLEGMRRALRPGGTVIIDVRNLLEPKNALRALRNATAKRFGKKLEYDPHFTTLGAMKRAAAAAGLRLSDWRGVAPPRTARSSSIARNHLAATLVLRLEPIP